MALYRHTSGFVCEYASSPGAGFTLISAQPTDSIANRVTWWRNIDKGSFTSAWHPSELSGAEVPGRDTNAGSGINILPNDYSSFEWAGAMPPTYTSGMAVNRTAAATYHGQYGVRLTTTSAGGTVWMAASGSDYNIALAPSSKWIVSLYVRPLTSAAVSLSINLKTEGGTTHTVTLNSGASSSEFARVSGVLDLSADASAFAQLGVSISNNSTSLDIDALMLEEQIGPYDTASTFYSPWGNGLSDGEIGNETITQDKLFGTLSDRIDLIDASSLVPGSVNARLASQYDTLVQQISKVSVGNGQFDSKIIWYFDQSSEITGWTGTSASLAVSGGYLTVTATGANPKFKTATIAVDGSAYQLVRLRVKRTGGSGWTGTLRYYYSGGSDVVTISAPAQIGSEYVEASWDMSAATLWKANTITAIEIQLGTASGDNYSIDWLGVGRNAPGASYSQVEAVRVLSDNKTRVFYSATNPTSDSTYTLKVNDLLFRTDQGNKPYRWNGSAWAESTDTRLADSWSEILDIRNATANPSGAAAQRINSISVTASSKNRTFYQASTSAPASPTTGDLWFQTDNGNKEFRWNGSAWVDATDTRLPTAVSSISNIENAKIGYCTIGGNTSTHGDKSACEAAGGTWNVGLPWATAVKQVSITAANGQSATVQQQFEAIYGTGGLRAQYSVKLDVNGYVAGFGLYNEGAGASGFIVRADKFVVGSAGSNTIPFEIVGGVTYIKSALIQDASITSAKIGTLNADRITGGFLSMDRISAGAITASKMAVGTITAASGIIADAAITSAKIGNAQIKTANIADLQVTSLKIADLTITEGKIAGNAITADKIAANTITATQIAAGAITSSALAANAVTAEKIAADSITSAKIAAGAVTASEISVGTITADKIILGGITTDRIAASAVTKTYAGSNTVTNTVVKYVAIQIFSQTVTSSYGSLGPVLLNISVSAVNPDPSRYFYIKCIVQSSDGFSFYQEASVPSGSTAYALTVPMTIVQNPNGSTSRTYTFYVQFEDGFGGNMYLTRTYSTCALLLQR